MIELNAARLTGKTYDEKAYASHLSAAVAEICRRQNEIGIDVINDGEFGKATRGPADYGAWQSYAWGRLGGWEAGPPREMPQVVGRRDLVKFADFYRELNTPAQTSTTPASGRPQVFKAPITYTGQAALRVDLENFKAALGKAGAEEGFITSIAPGSLGRRQTEMTSPMKSISSRWPKR